MVCWRAFAQLAEQACRRRVKASRASCLEARRQDFGQSLTKFHAPLVKTVDAPDDAGDKDAVFVHDEQGAECGGGEFVKDDGGAGPVARKVLVAVEVMGGLLTTMNSVDILQVPWCSHWKEACWPLLPSSPQVRPAVL